MSMMIKLWGVRGSLPAPYTPETVETRMRKTLESFFAEGYNRLDHVSAFLDRLSPETHGGFGGNTACVSVLTENHSIIIDGGSGLRLLGEELVQGPCGRGHGTVDLFFTHFHWDHLIGLPFFAPLFIAGNQIRFHAVQSELESCIRAIFKKPFFPVPFEALRSTISFHRLEARRPVLMGDLQVTPFQLDHPDPCWGYRVDHDGSHGRKSYAHCVDTECTRVTRAELGEDLALYQGVDLALFDAQYTLEEAQEKANWGHAAGPVGLEIAIREGIKQILFAHHDPAASDEKIAEAVRETQEYFDSQLDLTQREGRKRPDVAWSFAREGQEFKL